MRYGAGRPSKLEEGTAKGGSPAWCDGQLREPTRGVGDRSVCYKRISLAVEGGHIGPAWKQREPRKGMRKWPNCKIKR